MIRFRVRCYDHDNDRYIIKKGWCAATNLQEASEKMEEYYGNDIDEVTFKIFENYDDWVVEDGYLERQDSGDIRD